MLGERETVRAKGGGEGDEVVVVVVWDEVGVYETMSSTSTSSRGMRSIWRPTRLGM
jgi:hypothetical protein